VELRQQVRAMALPAAGEPPQVPPREPAAPAARAPAARGAATTFIVDSDGDGAPGGWARDGGDAASSPHAAPASAAAASAAAVDDGDDSDDSEAWLDAPAGYSHYSTRAVAEELGWAGGPLLPPERLAAGAKRPRGPVQRARARGSGGGDARFRDDE
jgi:hypothetical protein